MILALESVFDQCSVAFVDLDGRVIAEQTLTGNRLQTQQILPMIHTLMTDHAVNWSQLSAIAFNRGPGAFSGIRINTAVAQAIAFAHDLPCLPVSSLQAVAQSAYEAHQFTHVCALLDARMNQVYAGEFALIDKTMQPVSGAFEHLLDYDTDITQNKTQDIAQNMALVGNGATLVKAAATQTVVSDIRPSAAIIATLGLTLYQQGLAVPAALALPVYLRNNAWKTLAEQQQS